MTKTPSKKADTFEHSLKRLEEIVDKLEQGEVTLDEAIGMYEEGVQLSKECMDKLTHAELKFKKLSKDVNGDFKLSDIESDEES